jgi:Uri superfamily endonuclease
LCLKFQNLSFEKVPHDWTGCIPKRYTPFALPQKNQKQGAEPAFMPHPPPRVPKSDILPDTALPDRGIYVLRIRLHASLWLAVGALTQRAYPGGIYWYVGSAQRNLRSRVFRHLRTDKPLRWHIDYLLVRPESEIDAVFTLCADKSLECETAGRLSLHGEPVPRFGASDCRCTAHLVRTEEERAQVVAAQLVDLGFTESPPPVEHGA